MYKRTFQDEETRNPGKDAIEVNGVSKLYTSGSETVRALMDVELSVKENEFYTLLGPSGCGKTSLLRLIAGLDFPTSGSVRIRGADMTNVPAYRRPVNMVFQNYALFPHLSVGENVSYGPRQRQKAQPKEELREAVHQALAMVRLEGYESRRCHELSGGQQQRVALARAIINRPAVLILDEPLAALDRKLRTQMQVELKELQRSVGITFLLVTHDQDEALSMSDRICVMGGGRVVQIGSPRDIYDRPASKYVADFVGRTNFLPSNRRDHLISVRPERLQIAGKIDQLPEGTDVTVPARISHTIFLGEQTEYRVQTEAYGELTVLTTNKGQRDGGALQADAEVMIGWRSDDAYELPAHN